VCHRKLDAFGGGKGTPIDRASKDSYMEQLSSELKQFKPQRKIDKLKDFKSLTIDFFLFIK
jgi:hypothetical protein